LIKYHTQFSPSEAKQAKECQVSGAGDDAEGGYESNFICLGDGEGSDRARLVEELKVQPAPIYVAHPIDVPIDITLGVGDISTQAAHI
jgi:hypothetical protein